MSRSLFAALALVALASSCISTAVTPLTKTAYPPVFPTEVQVFFNQDDINAPYVELALIHAEGSEKYTDKEEMVEKAKVEAAKIGATGILVKMIQVASDDEHAEDSAESSETKGEMLAIRLLPMTREWYEERKRAAAERADSKD